MSRAKLFAVCVCALLGLLLRAAPVQAEDKPAVPEKPALAAEGTVKSVDVKVSTFVLTVKVAAEKPEDKPTTKDITIKLTDKTEYRLNGKKAAMDKVVKVGNAVKVMHRDAVAVSVDAKVAEEKPAEPKE